MSIYLVAGERAYRGHPTGQTFEATLDPDAERRALQRGAIVRLHDGPPSIQPGSYTLPAGWPTQHEKG